MTAKQPKKSPKKSENAINVTDIWSDDFVQEHRNTQPEFLRKILHEITALANVLATKSNAIYHATVLDTAARIIEGQHGDYQTLLTEHRKNEPGLVDEKQDRYIRQLLINTVAELGQRCAKLEIENRELRSRN